ncbi:helix-turn-helix domain-containing protein [Luteipulveratus mongoliensis]|uniref:helix-turn-helix domain-containing protein n=1 Tax=Luteipulveratus mongoliensis TaxID=571913 RepID=UPI0006960E13|nr:helix-turn-helix domain-containing protein [Luteipulveratus mongoliensis]
MTELTDLLRGLGLRREEAVSYEQLLKGPARSAEVAAATGLDESLTGAALDHLAEIGLVAPLRSDPSCFAPVTPEAGLDVLSALRESDIRRARIATMTAFDAFRRSVRPEPEDPIEVVTGAAMNPRIDSIVKSARTQIRALDSPPYTEGRASVEPQELQQLADGIDYRVVYSRASIEHPGMLENAIEVCLAAGEQSRVLPTVPVKLAIVDQEIGFVSLSIAEADVNRALLVIRRCSLLTALEALFEMCWAAATPLAVSAEPNSRPWIEPVDQRILALLAAGIPDADVAARVGLSRRSFFRHLEQLMQQAGVDNRFQLAVHAGRSGWI